MEDCRRNKINMLSQINYLPDLASLIFGKILYLLKNILSHKSWERKLLVDNDVWGPSKIEHTECPMSQHVEMPKLEEWVFSNVELLEKSSI